MLSSDRPERKADKTRTTGHIRTIYTHNGGPLVYRMNNIVLSLEQLLESEKPASYAVRYYTVIYSE